MKQIIDVFTGEVKSAAAEGELVSHAIGSCIVVTAFLPCNHSGAMAHIMLPGKAPQKHKPEKLRYAEDAIDELLLQLNIPQELYPEINFCLVGGGNVLKRQDDSICRNNITSVLDILKGKKFKINASSLGGNKRRTVRFVVENGEVYFTEDSSKEMLLWRFDE